jgi:iron(III) transport system permease protein
MGLALLVVIGAVTVVPVAFVLVESFNVAGPAQPFAWGLAGWQKAFSNARSLDAIGYSLLLSIRIPIAVAIAFVIAWLLVRVEVPGRKIIEYSLWFSFFLPVLPVTMGWVLLLDPGYGLINLGLKRIGIAENGLFSIYSVPGIIWVHISQATIPVMVILLAPALRSLDSTNEEAAIMSGASTRSVLRRVTGPLIAPAIVTATLIGFIRSLEVFEVEQLLGTPVDIFVYANRIYDLVSSEPPDYAQGLALCALFLLVLLIVAVVYQHYIGRTGGWATITGKGGRFAPRPVGRWGWVISGLLFLYVAISVVLPVTVLLLASFNRLFGFFFMEDAWTAAHWRQVFASAAFGRAILNSIVIGLSAGIAGTLLFAFIAWIIVRTTLWGRQVLSLLTWIPWIIPGLVLGLTLSAILLNTPIVSALYGTSAALVVAIVIKSMPLGVQMLRTSVHQVAPEMEEAAAMSGAGAMTIFRRIVLPLIAPMCVAVFLIVFMAALSDISTTVLLASAGTRTLSLLMFEFATSNRHEAAAVVGVLIALVCLAFTSIAFRIGMKSGIEG